MIRRIAIVMSSLMLLLVAVTPASAADQRRSRGAPVRIEAHAVFDGAETFVAHGGGLCHSGTVASSTQVIDLGDVLAFDVRKTFTCSSGIGTFDIHVVAAVHPCDPTDSGVWAVTGGTGAYANLQGSGTQIGTYFPGDSCNADGVNDHYTGFVRGARSH